MPKPVTYVSSGPEPDPRWCNLCQQHRPIGPQDIGWEPLHDGWSCPACTRTYERRIQERAAVLLLSPDRSWRAAATNLDHPPMARCEHCDVLRQAIAWLLVAEPRPWFRQRLRELGIDHLVRR